MNLPNKITLARILLIPVFVLFFYLDFKLEYRYNYLVAALFFALAALTDFLDGYIARSRNLVTNMGKFLDPIADKALVSTALILLLTDSRIFTSYAANAGRVIAGLCVALIIARELIIGGFRLVAVEKHAVIAADKLGKLKTVLQDFTIFVVLIGMAFLDMKTYEAFNVIALILLMLSTLLTVVSGANYILKNRQVLMDEEKDEDTE